MSCRAGPPVWKACVPCRSAAGILIISDCPPGFVLPVYCFTSCLHSNKDLRLLREIWGRTFVMADIVLLPFVHMWGRIYLRGQQLQTRKPHLWPNTAEQLTSGGLGRYVSKFISSLRSGSDKVQGVQTQSSHAKPHQHLALT